MFMRNGEMQESKLWAKAYKGAGLWVLLNYTEKVLADWTLLTALMVVGIAPDLLKKLITMRTKQ